MRIHDISLPITADMVVWPGDAGVGITAASRISEGDSANTSQYCFGSHTGTHVDPPIHFVEGGTTVDQLPLDVLVGECHVCVLGDVPVIDISVLEGAGIPAGTKRLLFKTRNSELWEYPVFRTDFTYIDENAASRLIEWGVRLVGIDYLSVEKYHAGGHPTHLALLRAGVVVVEGLDLRAVQEGTYRLICLPLKVAGGDGSPARAILIEGVQSDHAEDLPAADR